MIMVGPIYFCMKYFNIILKGYTLVYKESRQGRKSSRHIIVFINPKSAKYSNNFYYLYHIFCFEPSCALTVFLLEGYGELALIIYWHFILLSSKIKAKEKSLVLEDRRQRQYRRSWALFARSLTEDRRLFRALHPFI